MQCTEALKVMYEVEDNPQKARPTPEATAHLEECSNCQQLLKWDSSIKKTVRQKGAEKTVPAGLATRIAAEIRHQESLSWREKLTWLWPGRPWGWIGAATAMVLILGIIGIRTLTRPTTSRFVAWCFEEHQEYVEEGFQLDIVSSDPTTVDDWFLKTIRKDPDVSRFLGVDLTLLGGKKLEFAGMNSALGCFKKSETLISLYAVPSLDIEIEDLKELKLENKNLWIGTEGELTQVVWLENDLNLTCSLVAQLPENQLLEIVKSL